MNVPNHAQADRIASDLKKLAQHAADTIKPWQGNSYQGRAYKDRDTGLWIYELVHWSTTIAQFTVTGNGVIMTYFNARYISSTTRSFQGRILSGMMRGLYSGTRHGWASIVSDELSLPTHQRGVISPSF